MTKIPLSFKSIKSEQNNLKKWFIYQKIAHIMSCIMMYELFLYRLYFSRYKKKCPGL